TDTARVDLSFPVTDINDLLKSMVLRDLDGGHISTVSYDSNAPVERTLKSFAINLTGNPTLGGILNQARGEKVEVVLQQVNGAQPGNLSGTVVGMEKKKAVSIQCVGEGKRDIRVGYVIENPIWKTSYRLVLGKKEKPYLQGWAIV